MASNQTDWETVMLRNAGLKFTILCVALLFAGPLLAERPTHAPSSSANQSVTPAVQPTAGSGYIIGDDDLLGINVWNEPDFKLSIPVRSDGNISLPLIGQVHAAGRTPSQLQNVIAAKLQAFIKQPQVTVMVMEMNSRKFNILGRVLKPGSYPLTASTTVLDAIAIAGGFQNFAKKKDIYILRPKASGGENRLRFNYKQVIHGQHLEENIRLEPGDTVVVP